MAGQQIKYEVAGGETLQSLARQFYAGNEGAWRRIHDRNSDAIGPNPNYLPPGLRESGLNRTTGPVRSRHQVSRELQGEFEAMSRAAHSVFRQMR